MELYYKQTDAGLRIRFSLIKTDGTNAVGATGLSTILIDPNGDTQIGDTDYTDAVITEIEDTGAIDTGIYECYFPTTAPTKAFDDYVDHASPYTLILDSTDADIEYTKMDLRIVSVMPWEVATEATSLSISGDIQDVQSAIGDIDLELDGLATEATVLSISGDINDATYGLSALKDIFDELKGVGWTDETFKSIKDAIDVLDIALTAIKGAGFDTGTHSLKEIKNRIG